MKKLNLKGSSFKKLTVIKEDPNRKNHWICECTCGNVKSILTSNLTTGKIKSCGCLRTENSLINLTGKIIGNLKVIRRLDDKIQPSKDKKTKWECECKCGKTIYVLGQSLRKGIKTDCGCIKKENKLLKNLIGKRFGKLVVLARDSDYVSPAGFHLTRWACKCDCGIFVSVTKSCLKKQYSCGCISESYVASYLKKYCSEKYKSISEYGLFINPKTNHWLKCDIYISSKNLFVEVHGGQHYEFIKYFHKTRENFEYDKYLDKIKRKFCNHNGYYLEIDLRKIKSPEQARDRLEKYLEKI